MAALHVEATPYAVAGSYTTLLDTTPRGARPFGREAYVGKFRALAEDVLEPAEQDRFLDLAARLPELDAAELAAPTVTAAGLPDGEAGLF